MSKREQMLQTESNPLLLSLYSEMGSPQIADLCQAWDYIYVYYYMATSTILYFSGKAPSFRSNAQLFNLYWEPQIMNLRVYYI